jgi:hypothetical protein
MDDYSDLIKVGSMSEEELQRRMRMIEIPDKKDSKEKQFHFHRTEHGTLTRCYHNCKQLLLSWQFWIGTLVSFPLEHALYEYVWPFTLITKLLSLS